jgi:hypothetical protein
MSALSRQNLLDFARRPLDLDWLISYWKHHSSFGSLKDMLERSLRERLEEKDPQRARKDPSSSDTLMAGLERVGAALVMQRRQDVLVPDSALAGDLRLEAVDLADVLPDWSAGQRMSLLGRSVFDPARSGLARLHNDNQGVVRAYLTARWLYGAHNRNCPLSEIRSLLFATTYGVEVVVPSMRLVAAWLALWLPHEVDVQKWIAERLRLLQRDSYSVDREPHVFSVSLMLLSQSGQAAWRRGAGGHGV